MAKGKSLSLLRAWVDDHTSGTFSCDREYSWDAVGGAIMFHEGRFIGLRIKFKNGCYEVTGCDKKRAEWCLQLSERGYQQCVNTTL